MSTTAGKIATGIVTVDAEALWHPPTSSGPLPRSRILPGGTGESGPAAAANVRRYGRALTLCAMTRWSLTW